MNAEIALLIIGLLAAGYASGVLAGLLGVGGGIILVPVLFQSFVFMELPPALQIHMAVGTSLAIICFTAMQSAREHWRKGVVDIDILKSWGVPIALGALSGAIAARFIVPEGLKIIFAFFSLTLGIRMAFLFSGAGNGGETRHSGLPLWAQKFLSACIGFFSALMGIGGGTLSVPLLGLVGRDVHHAVGTSAALGFLIAVPATLGFIIGGWGVASLPSFALGYVHGLAVLLMIPAAMLGAPIGVALAHRLSKRTLGLVFAAFLLLGGGRMLVSLF